MADIKPMPKAELRRLMRDESPAAAHEQRLREAYAKGAMFGLILARALGPDGIRAYLRATGHEEESR
jgi:hypothetical protein